MTPTEAAAVEAAVRAAEAAEATPGAYRGTKPPEVLEARLGPQDWSDFGGRGYALLREVHKRVSGWSGPTGGSPDGDGGGRYEDSMSAARERLVRAFAAA